MITGYVYDKDTSLPIYLANVVEIGDDGITTQKGTTTNDKGFFSLNTTKDIAIGMIGYETIRTKPLSDKKYYIKSVASNLSEVEVFGKKTGWVQRNIKYIVPIVLITGVIIKLNQK